jgi:hypothetical protein
MARMKFNSDRSKFIVLYQKWSDRKLYAKGGTWDGTNGASSGITLGSEFTVINAALDSSPFEWQRGVDLACDTGSNKWVAAFEYGSQSKAICLTLSGTTVSKGTMITVDTQNPDGKFRVADNFSTPNCVTWAGLYTSGLGVGNIVISGTNTLTATVNQGFGNGPDNDCNVAIAPGLVKNSNQTAARAIYVLWRRNGSEPRGLRANVSTPGTNVDYINCIGFANSAINDGATGTIHLDGNTVDNQSGLTAATRYYVQSDGTLGTTQFQGAGGTNVKSGGIALSSTKLLIRATYAE